MLKRTAQEADLVYGELPPSLRRKLQPKSTQTDKPEPGNLAGLVPVVAHGSIPTKLANKVLPLENPGKESDRRKREKENAKREREKRKIADKHRRSGRLVKVPGSQNIAPSKGKPLARGQVSYDLLEPLHRLWLGYISELLTLPLRNAVAPMQIARELQQEAPSTSSTPASVSRPESSHTRTVSVLQDGTSLTQMQGWQAKLVKADFHGCKLEVKKAKHPSLVGLAGIVVQETENTFRVVTPKNVIKVIPKENVTYTFTLPLETPNVNETKDLRFELHGGNFAFRGSDRASKKFKAKGSKGLSF